MFTTATVCKQLKYPLIRLQKSTRVYPHNITSCLKGKSVEALYMVIWKSWKCLQDTLLSEQSREHSRYALLCKERTKIRYIHLFTYNEMKKLWRLQEFTQSGGGMGERSQGEAGVKWDFYIVYNLFKKISFTFQPVL